MAWQSYDRFIGKEVSPLAMAYRKRRKLCGARRIVAGCGKRFVLFVMITLGTGVGGAFYSQETGIFHGAHSLAGELGHVLLFPGGRPCNCGQKGCVEQYASGTALKNSTKSERERRLKAAFLG